MLNSPLRKQLTRTLSGLIELISPNVPFGEGLCGNSFPLQNISSVWRNGTIKWNYVDSVEA